MFLKNHLLQCILTKIQSPEIQIDTLKSINKLLDYDQTLSKKRLIDNGKGVISFFGQSLDLSKEQKLYEIFKFFINSKNAVITREELLLAIYNIESTAHMSKRQEACVFHNIIKLLSRVRTRSQEIFNAKNLDLEWFVFSQKRGGWHLMIMNRLVTNMEDINLHILKADSSSKNNESPDIN